MPKLFIILKHGVQKLSECCVLLMLICCIVCIGRSSRSPYNTNVMYTHLCRQDRYLELWFRELLSSEPFEEANADHKLHAQRDPEPSVAKTL